MEKKHILIIGDINSLVNELDFSKNKYSLLTSQYEADNLSTEIKYSINIFGIASTEEFDVSCFESSISEILNIVDDVIEISGTIDWVVTTYEHTVLTAAMIRSHYNIKGLKKKEVQVLRDKDMMKKMVSSKGLAVPEFHKITQENYFFILTEFFKRHKKVVIKPLNQAASQGVLITESISEATQHIEKLLSTSNHIGIEEFVNSSIMHFDGIVQNGEIKFISVSRKVGNCYNYVNNSANLSTIVLNDQQIYIRAKNYVNECLAALEITSSVFHLEVFESNENFIFLEIAGRYPGGGISQLIKKTFNFDFISASYLFDCQKEIALYDESKKFKPTAMLLIPLPQNKDVHIVGINGLNNLPRNIIGSQLHGPGETVKYHPLNPFNSLGRFYISDVNIECILNTIRIISSEVNFKHSQI